MAGAGATHRPARAVFLDRDGVLTVPMFRDGRSYAPRRLEDLKFYPDAELAVRELKAAGFLTIVVTNQPDVGAGLVDASVVEAMHDCLRSHMAIDDIEVCTESREQATERRKPGAGMLLDAAERWRIDLGQSYLIGDRASDIEAAQRAGCKGIWIDLGYTSEPAPTGQSATVQSVSDAVRWILGDMVRNDGPGEAGNEGELDGAH